jgi:Protein of unknown function (DUF4232)
MNDLERRIGETGREMTDRVAVPGDLQQRIAARIRRRRWTRQALALTGAAVLVVLAVGVAILTNHDHSNGTRLTFSGTTTPPSQPGTTSNVVGSVPPGTSPGSAGPTATSAGTTATSAGTTVNGANPHPCGSAALSASLSNTQGAAGTIYSHLVFRNVSATSCTVSGYPGVSFVDGAGHQIGGPAQRASGDSGVVTVGPGQSAGAVLAIHDTYVSNTPNCASTTTVGLRIYPPNQTAAQFTPGQFTVCANPAANGSASVTAVTALANLPG